MTPAATDAETWTAADIEDLLVLTQMLERRERQGGRCATAVDQAHCLRLVRRCAVVPVPHAPNGYRVSLVGMSRLYRFVHSPVGSAPDLPVDGEIAARIEVLEALAPPDRQEIETRMCAELVEIRAGFYRCAHADLCAGRGCPFELEVGADAVDRALCALLPKSN